MAKAQVTYALRMRKRNRVWLRCQLLFRCEFLVLCAWFPSRLGEVLGSIDLPTGKDVLEISGLASRTLIGT